jgi:hypothetical protein
MSASSLLVPVLAASLVGSLHCVGMCGGFVAFYSGGDESSGRRKALGHLAYHLGRLSAYASLGALAGAAGAAVDLAGSAAGVGKLAAFVAGGVMVLWGLALLLLSVGVRLPRLRLPRRMHTATVRFMGGFRAKPPVMRALLLGLSSALLPCGWLYAFAVTAAGTGSAPGGALVMLAFWVGTVPLLLGLGVGIQGVAGKLRRHVPAISAVTLIVVGLFGVLGRVNVPSLAAHGVHAAIAPAGQSVLAPAGQAAPCH